MASRVAPPAAAAVSASSVLSAVSVSPPCVSTENVPEPLDFRSSEVTTDSFRVSWEHPAQDVVLYRLIWSPTDGGNPEDVCVFLHRGPLGGAC